MTERQVHFEVFVRKPGRSGFALELATESRERALEVAEELLETKSALAVKVTKETQDGDSGEFDSVTILSKGEAPKAKPKGPIEDRGPPCVSPADLYHVHSRDVIGRLLEGWLTRNRATPFELLHRADLIEKLDASGVELQHAIQKIAVPEAQARGVSVHEVIRGFQQLIQRGMDRVMADQRKGAFPILETAGDLPGVCARLEGEPERLHFMGAAVSNFIAPATGWGEKVGLLLDLADAAPKEGPGRGLVFKVIEQPLSEMLRSRVGLADLLGADLDLGGSLAALTRLAAADAVELMAKHDKGVARLMPPLTGPAERLAVWFSDPALQAVRGALFKRVLHELTTMRRVRPSDARGEIDILRALAMALTAASGKLLLLDDVRAAFIERSKMLVAADFVEAYLRDERPALQEAADLVWLMENVTGGTNKRQAARWLLSSVTSLRFDTELTQGADSPSARLARLAELYRQVGRAGAGVAGSDLVREKLGDMGRRIEAQANLVGLLVRSSAPTAQKLGALLKMASGEAAPPGPAAERAKAEVLKLMRNDAVRAELARAPETLAHVRTVMQALEAAA